MIDFSLAISLKLGNFSNVNFSSFGALNIVITK